MLVIIMKLLITAICSTLLFISVYIYFYIDLSDIFHKKEVQASEAKEEEEVMVIHDIYEITAYTAGYESTGKTPSHPAYGITASGEVVKENYTIACPPELEFGTEVYIPYFSQKFVCKDRGGAIKGKALDVYMEKLVDAKQFGRQMLEVHILKQE